jgi:hypothetical protein
VLKLSLCSQLPFRAVAAVVVVTAGGDMAPLARNETLMQECCAAVATASCIDILGVSATFVEAIGACGAFRLRTGNLP